MPAAPVFGTKQTATNMGHMLVPNFVSFKLDAVSLQNLVEVSLS